MEGLPIAFESAAAGAVILPPDVRYATASHVDKVFCRQPADFFVIHADKVSGQSGQMSRSTRTYG